MSNLVSSNAPGKKCKEVTCCAKCTFFTRKKRKIVHKVLQCCCTLSNAPVRKDATVKAKKEETLPVIWIICFNQGFLNLAVMFSIQS